jgi:DNA repair protein RadA
MAKATEIEDIGGFEMGEPYYCAECKRNHTKGKIYKEHLNFAQIETQNEEDINDEDIESTNDDFDDEEELIEAFEELEIDANNIEFENRPEEKIEIDDVDIPYSGDSIQEAINAVKKLPGVGEATLNKLIKAGFSSLESIAFTPPKIIQNESGLGDKTTSKLIKASMEKLNIGFKSAEDIWEHRKNIARITTGSQELDDLLGGGVETGSLIEFFGEFRTGKTQIMHQLCVNVQLNQEKGGIEGRALYIDTEGTFRPERIIQMAEGLDLDHNKILKNIVFGRAYNSDHQIVLIKEASNLIKEQNIKLIVVDSLIGHFRSEYIGRGTLANRQQLINSHLHDLLRLCDIYTDLAIVVTNQVQSKPDVFYGKEQRIAKIVDAPHLPEGDAIFSITENGISD